MASNQLISVQERSVMTIFQVAWLRLGIKENDFLTVGTFTWIRENNIMVDHKLEEGQISYWNLIIKAVQKEDEGMYQCQITDKVPLRTHVYLTVKPRPAIKPAVVVSGAEFVDRNEPIRLQCNATGPKIPEDIDWFKDGTKLDTRATKNPNIIITKYMSLEAEFARDIKELNHWTDSERGQYPKTPAVNIARQIGLVTPDQVFISDLVIEHTDTDNSGTYICRSSDREIDSIKVTVLVADTTNVKRAQKEDRQFGGARSTAKSVFSPAFLSVLLWILLTFAS